MDEAPQVAGLGSIVVDVLMTAENITPNQKNPVEGQTFQIGGVIPTALVALARLGITTEFRSTVGDDLFGDTLRKMLSGEHVQTQGLATATHQTPFAFVVAHPKSSKRTSFYTTGAFSSASGDLFSQAFDKKTTHLLIDGHNPEASQKLMMKAKQENVMVFLDIGNPKPGLEALMPLADALIVPTPYWQVKWNGTEPDRIAQELLEKGPSLVVLTMEEKGCIVAQKGNIFHQPSYAIDAIDTNGAGDVFFGTFVYGLIQQWGLPKTAKFAAAAAARSCTLVGKDAKIPRSAQEVFDFMATHTPTEA